MSSTSLRADVDCCETQRVSSSMRKVDRVLSEHSHLARIGDGQHPAYTETAETHDRAAYQPVSAGMNDLQANRVILALKQDMSRSRLPFELGMKLNRLMNLLTREIR